MPSFRLTPLSVGLPVATLVCGGLLSWGLFALDAPPTPLPGRSFRGSPAPLGADEQRLGDGLRRDVEHLAREIGERNTRRPRRLAAAAAYVATRLRSAGLRDLRQSYRADGIECSNVYADIGPRAGEQLLLAAHYDSAIGSPGGNDNASGVAVLLALAERLTADAPDRWIRLVFFVNEEPPHFQSRTMGSRVYARWAAERGALPDQVVVLDSLGFYSEEPDSQRFPSPRLTHLFGDRGDFVAFVSDGSSESLLLRFGGAFRAQAELPSQGCAFPLSVAGVTWSDHASFWAHGVPAILVSDTAAFRDPSYHERSDRGDQIDYEALTRLMLGLEHAVRSL